MGQKIKITALNFLHENLEKFRSTNLYDAPLEGSTIFLCRSSMSRNPLDSSRLAELKYAFFSRTGRNTKKLQRSNLFPLTIFEHWLLEGSTFLFQYSLYMRYTIVKLSIRRAEMCNFTRIDWKTRAFESAKNDIAQRAYMVTVVGAARGIDNFISLQLLKPCTVG